MTSHNSPSRDLCLYPMEDDRFCQRLVNHKGAHHWDVEYRQIKMHPWAQVRDNFAKQIEAGAIGFQSWTCEGCGAVQRMMQANGFYDEGGCENCGHVTNLVRKGCNFTLMVLMGGQRSTMRDILKNMGFKPPRDN